MYQGEVVNSANRVGKLGTHDLVGIGDLGTEIGLFDALDQVKARSVSEWLQLDPAYRASLRILGGESGDRAL